MKTFECCDQCENLFPEGSLNYVKVKMTFGYGQSEWSEYKKHLCDNCLREAEGRRKQIKPVPPHKQPGTPLRKG